MRTLAAANTSIARGSAAVQAGQSATQDSANSGHPPCRPLGAFRRRSYCVAVATMAPTKFGWTVTVPPLGALSVI
jgi:hypothetical protein